MTRAEALRLVTELRELTGGKPGADPGGLKRATEIRLAFRDDPCSTGYLQQKMDVVMTYLDYWCRPRKWRQFGADPTRLKSILTGSVSNLESAVDLAYRDPAKR